MGRNGEIDLLFGFCLVLRRGDAVLYQHPAGLRTAVTQIPVKGCRPPRGTGDRRLCWIRPRRTGLLSPGLVRNASRLSVLGSRIGSLSGLHRFCSTFSCFLIFKTIRGPKMWRMTTHMRVGGPGTSDVRGALLHNRPALH